MKRRVDIAPTPQAPRHARARLSELLAPDDPVRDRALLLVSELVTNAVLHAGSDLILTIEERPACLHVDVTDASNDLPIRIGRPDERGGFGLMILDAVADRWGVTQADGGKSVWFEFDR